MVDATKMSAYEKEEVLRQWIQFVQNGFKNEHFTELLYNHLIQHCFFSNHYGHVKFYDKHFSSVNAIKKFVSQFDLSLGAKSIELGTDYWIVDPQYRDINLAMCKSIEPYLSDIYKIQPVMSYANSPITA